MTRVLSNTLLLSTIRNAVIVPTDPRRRDYVHKAQIIYPSLYFQLLRVVSAHPTRQSSEWRLVARRQSHTDADDRMD